MKNSTVEFFAQIPTECNDELICPSTWAFSINTTGISIRYPRPEAYNLNIYKKSRNNFVIHLSGVRGGKTLSPSLGGMKTRVRARKER